MPFHPGKYWRSLLAFMLALALFLVGLDSFLFLREQRRHDLELDEKAIHDLELIGAFITEPMLREEFGQVEQFLLQWGRNNPEVLALHAFFPGGQALTEYESAQSASEVHISGAPVYFEGRHLLSLEIVKNREFTDTSLFRFKRDLLFFSLTITAFIGAVLWYLLKFMAIRPLEREIVRRRQIEEELHQARSLLETKVEERTQELTVAVEELHHEVEERHRAEQELAAEKERLVVTLRSIGDGVISTDTEGRIILMNKMAERLTGWEHEQALGRPLAEVFKLVDGKTGSPMANPIAKALRTGQAATLSGPAQLVAKNGVCRDVADSAAPIHNEQSEMVGAVLVFRDETEKNRMAADLIKIKKLESVGLLAGGIAHDFNNILAAILGNIDLALYVAKEENIRSLLESAKKASYRARKLTGQLLTFAKGGEPVKKLAAIAEVIRDSAEFVLRGSKVHGEFSLPPDLWPVSMDSGQISQVVQNIVINAVQAMPDGGVVEISCANVQGQKGETMVGISIRDHGPGIPGHLLENIFDPYFTTKQEGHGLGLAVTHSIIAKHGGRIEVQSEQGQGTLFFIYLPASPTGKISETPVIAQGKLAKPARVLVMDDDEMIRNLAAGLLSYLGCRVNLARDGEEALKIYRECREAGERIDLVIMDLTIPGGMGGREAIRELLALDPAARVIVASGYSNDPVMANYREYGFAAMLSKPFGVTELTEAINRVLAG